MGDRYDASSALFRYAPEVISVPEVNDELGERISLDYINRISDLQNPLERLKTLWLSVLFVQDRTQEAKMIHSTAFTGAVAGLTYGALPRSLEYSQEFVRRYNVATFDNRYKARRDYLDTLLWRSGSMGAKYAIKAGLLSGLISATFFSSISYRNDLYITDTSIGTGLICGCARSFLGPRAFLVGALTGSVLGLLGGACFKGFLALTGMSAREWLYWNHSEWKASQEAKAKLAVDIGVTEP